MVVGILNEVSKVASSNKIFDLILQGIVATCVVPNFSMKLVVLRRIPLGFFQHYGIRLSEWCLIGGDGINMINRGSQRCVVIVTGNDASFGLGGILSCLLGAAISSIVGVSTFLSIILLLSLVAIVG